MSKTKASELPGLIDRIAGDARGEGEQLWAFLRALNGNIPVPCGAMVIGEAVQVTKVEFDGNARRGITATCVCRDGSKYVVSAVELVMPPEFPKGKYVDAYRQWMGQPKPAAEWWKPWSWR